MEISENKDVCMDGYTYTYLNLFRVRDKHTETDLNSGSVSDAGIKVEPIVRIRE